MSIDPAKITVDDLDRYEQMMQGDGASGVSNSNVALQNSVRHTWQVWQNKDEIGPMQVRLSQPTNLIQLNIDLKFKCNSMSDLND